MRNKLIGKRLKNGEFAYKKWCNQPAKAYAAQVLLIALAAALGLVSWIACWGFARLFLAVPMGLERQIEPGAVYWPERVRSSSRAVPIERNIKS